MFTLNSIVTMENKHYNNTTEKGNELENDVYNVLNKTLNCYGKLVKLRKHKDYVGQNNRTIIVDVSIDVFTNQKLFEEDKPTFTYIFECKNLNRILDIAEYDEWIGKLNKLGKTGHKLFIVTREGFSDRTISEARLDKVGLIKLPYGATSFNYIVPRTINKFGNNELMKKLSINDGSNEIICYDDNTFMSFIDILLINKIPVKQNYLFDIPNLKNYEIEMFVNDLISKYRWNDHILYDLIEKFELPPVLSKKMELGRLANLNITSSQICMSDELELDSTRYRFVLAHELGHYFLHKDIIAEKISSFFDDEESLKIWKWNETQSKLMEQQANRFASFLLMPKNLIEKEIIDLFDFCDIRDGYMYVDSQACNIGNYNIVVPRLSKLFKVSKQAIAYRLMDLGLMKMTDEAKYKFGL